MRGFDLEALCSTAFFGQQAGGEHDARVGGVGAAGDGGDEHGRRGDREDEVGGGDAGREGAAQVHADDVGGEEVERLAEHAGLGLDAADAPADDAEPVDHGGVRIGADQGVRVQELAAAQDAAGEVLEVDLVDDADAGRDHVEAVEGGGAPLQEFVALAVATKLDRHVAGEGVGDAGEVDLHRVVDDEVDGDQRLDDGGVVAHAGDGAAHRGEVDQQRHAGEVLQDDARDHEGDLGAALGLRGPAGEGADVLLADPVAVDVAQHGLEEHAEAAREPGHVEARAGERGQAVVARDAAVGEGELRQGVKGVSRAIHARRVDHRDQGFQAAAPRPGSSEHSAGEE
jgi:hypothetical protein